MIRSLSLQWYGDSLLSCNASSLIVGEWPHLCLAGTMRWMKIDVTLVHCLFYGRGYNRDYQLPPYSEVIQLWDDHRNMEIFFLLLLLFFFFFAVVVLRVPFPALIAQLQCGTHHGHVSYSDWLEGLISGETFKLSHALRGKSF